MTNNENIVQYKKAFCELEEIIKIMPEELSSKISEKFKEFIHRNKEKEYNPKISMPLEEQKILVETKILLSLIYREYLCSPEERIKLKQKDQEELLKKEKEAMAKYDIQKKFDSQKEKIQNKVEQKNVALVEYRPTKWYEKIKEYIKKIIKRRKY